MQKIFTTIILLFVANTNFAQSKAHPDWKLMWSDEFNYTGLPDSTKWGYDEGFIRNNEKQYYTVARKQNAWVQNGVLTITGRQEGYPNRFYKPGSNDWHFKDSLSGYTSANLITLHKQLFTYGRMEMRAKIPQGLGVWPAFWMLGSDRGLVRWPYCGEIDIMEFVGHDPSHIYGTLHYADTATKKHASSGGKIETIQPYNGFHVYAVEWAADGIDIYFDDSLYHHFNINDAGTGADNPFRKPFYLLLNLALGGTWGGPINNSVLPAEYVIDYVRVWGSGTVKSEE